MDETTQSLILDLLKSIREDQGHMRTEQTAIALEVAAIKEAMKNDGRFCQDCKSVFRKSIDNLYRLHAELLDKIHTLAIDKTAIAVAAETGAIIEQQVGEKSHKRKNLIIAVVVGLLGAIGNYLPTIKPWLVSVVDKMK